MELRQTGEAFMLNEASVIQDLESPKSIYIEVAHRDIEHFIQVIVIHKDEEMLILVTIIAKFAYIISVPFHSVLARRSHLAIILNKFMLCTFQFNYIWLCLKPKTMLRYTDTPLHYFSTRFPARSGNLENLAAPHGSLHTNKLS